MMRLLVLRFAACSDEHGPFRLVPPAADSCPATNSS
jgi:hypothetical protein